MAGWTGGKGGSEYITTRYSHGGPNFVKDDVMAKGECIKTGQNVKGNYNVTDSGEVWIPGGGRYQYFYKAMDLDGKDLGFWVRGGEFQWLNKW
ncbi:hypothetical protein [Nocardia sp. NPDC057030]|uniref:hypothetical protein n=1 Tax=unclassified Nocardia TaxID=2637762 RepID=UPI003643E46F